MDRWADGWMDGWAEGWMDGWAEGWMEGWLRGGYLGLGEAEAAGQLLALGAHHVVVLLEGPLQPQELRRREGGADALGLPSEGAVEEQALLGHLVPYGQRAESGARAGTPSPAAPALWV